MRTFSAKPDEVERRWWVVDASDVPLGRLASRVATVLRGKHRPEFTPHVDTGDFVVVINAEGLDITLAAKVGAKAIEEVRVQTKTSITGAIKFISENAVDGTKHEVQFHKVTVKADGELSLIGDDWGEMPFSGAAEKNEDMDANSPTMRIRKVAA